ncbi:unnamed protein product [Spirodela intermedia]|uniref:TBCC domain-containing protein 1 n=1 Tax=Spirodela intermedia TaxID=51605 RepID=A0A7I8IWR9_SPIIN|nr:unnamed protein product [Spirodela intermedia]CAA6661591.1 unnamed protein product [Spirodela intermedia]
MNEERPDPSAAPPLLLRPRREVFEYGLLPIPKLIFTDGTLTLDPSSRGSSRRRHRINPFLCASPDAEPRAPEGAADVHDLLLFLFVQSYKRLLPRTHKDAAAVADVWPHASAFDGYLSALSPLQFVRSNNRRFMPSQADEEAHQLSYLQKHMSNILALLGQPVEGEGEESLPGVTLFVNSDPDMPAAPVSVSQVLDWLLENIAASLEQLAEKQYAKDNGALSISDVDVTMTDACSNQGKGQSPSPTGTTLRSQAFVEGISKASVVRQACDLIGSTVKVLNCHDSVIYILAPLRYATIYGCSDATVVLGAIGKAVRVEHCERVQVIAAGKRICIANCRECMFFLGVNQRPLILGDNHKLQVAPYNTYYSKLNEHLAQVCLDTAINRWNEPVVLGMVDPHDSLSHPAGVSDVQAESATCLDPDQFTMFLIPSWFGGESAQPTSDNPFQLPEIYRTSQERRRSGLNDIHQALRESQLEENRKQELSSAIHVHFKDWLYASGNIRQLYCLQGD